MVLHHLVHAALSEHVIHRVAFSSSPSEAIDTLYDLYFYSCYELALDTSVKISGFMTSATPTH